MFINSTTISFENKRGKEIMQFWRKTNLVGFLNDKTLSGLYPKVYVVRNQSLHSFRNYWVARLCFGNFGPRYNKVLKKTVVQERTSDEFLKVSRGQTLILIYFILETLKGLFSLFVYLCCSIWPCSSTTLPH